MSTHQPDGTVKLRDCRSEEATKVALLLRAAYKQYQEALPFEVWRMYFADIMDVRGRGAHGNTIVAEVEDKIVGTVTVRMAGGDGQLEEVWPVGWAIVHLLAVNPQHRGRGTGRALMDECVSRCRDKRIPTIGLHTATIMDVALRMCERIGFERVPEFDLRSRPEAAILAYRLDL